MIMSMNLGFPLDHPIILIYIANPNRFMEHQKTLAGFMYLKQVLKELATFVIVSSSIY